VEKATDRPQGQRNLRTQGREPTDGSTANNKVSVSSTPETGFRIRQRLRENHLLTPLAGPSHCATSPSADGTQQ